MTTNPRVVDEAEAHVRQLSDHLTRPRERECLCCYLARMIVAFGCDGSFRFAHRYRETMAPRATNIVGRLRRLGACCCSCELFLNGYWPRPVETEPRADADDPDEDGDSELLGLDTVPPCIGVQRGSLLPCGNWVSARTGL